MRYLLLFSLIISTAAHAFSWNDLWQTRDQQGAAALTAGKPVQAAKLFKNKQWAGVAHYRMGDYKAAYQDFSKAKSALAAYNQGNALAHLGQYDAAIAAYKQALAFNRDYADAQYNIELLEKLKKKQNKQTQPRNQKNKNQADNNKQQDQNQQQHQKQQPESSKQQQSTQAQQQQQQDLKQWLRRIPDDPGGLLRQKFKRDHQRYQQALQQGKHPW